MIDEAYQLFRLKSKPKVSFTQPNKSLHSPI